MVYRQMGISVKGSLSIILTVLPDCTLGHFIPIIMMPYDHALYVGHMLNSAILGMPF